MTLDDITAAHHGTDRYDLASQVASEVARRFRAEAAHDAVLKLCTGCAELKPRSAFHRDDSRPDGRYRVCRECRV